MRPTQKSMRRKMGLRYPSSLKPLSTPAIGHPQSSYPEGELFFNVRDYGAKGDGTQDDAPAFQACIDALAVAQKTVGGHGTVFVPQGGWGYLFNEPVFMDQPDQTMVGGGTGCRIQCVGANPALYLGVSRVKPTDATRFVDSFGVLDKTAAPAASCRCGWKMGQGDTVPFQANCFQYGSSDNVGHYTYWNEPQLTVEFCVDFPGDNGVIPVGVQLLGFGTWQNTAPFVFYTDGNLGSTFVFAFQTKNDLVPRSFNFSVAGFTGPYKVAFQIDMVAGTATAFVNDVSVEVKYGDMSGGDKTKLPDAWGPGLSLAENDSQCFVIGGSVPDFTLYGLRISKGLRYADPGVTNPLPTPPSDSQRYFVSDANTIAYLVMDFNDYMSQSVTYGNNGGIYGKAYRLTSSGKGWNANISVKNITVNGSNWGTGITVGNLFGPVELDHVTASGAIGVASLPIACTYPISLSNCVLSGQDCAFFGYFLILKANNISISQAGRDCIRCVSCDTYWDTVFVGGPSVDTVFKFYSNGYGCMTRMDNVIIDFEGYNVNKAIVYAENCADVPGTTLSLRDFSIGTVGPNAACVMLKDMAAPGGSFGKAWVSIENVFTWGPYRTFLETDGALWGGVINGYFLDPKSGPLHNHIPLYSPTNNITFTNTVVSAFPASEEKHE